MEILMNGNTRKIILKKRKYPLCATNSEDVGMASGTGTFDGWFAVL